MRRALTALQWAGVVVGALGIFGMITMAFTEGSHRADRWGALAGLVGVAATVGYLITKQGQSRKRRLLIAFTAPIFLAIVLLFCFALVGRSPDPILFVASGAGAPVWSGIFLFLLAQKLPTD